MKPSAVLVPFGAPSLRIARMTSGVLVAFA